MRALTVYIAGPMRGLPDNNVPAFRTAEQLLRGHGWTVQSPVTIGEEAFGNDPSVPSSEYMRRDLLVLARCTTIALLPGWERSTGARCEVVVALTLGLLFLDALTGHHILSPTRVVCNGGYEQPPGAVETLDALAEEVVTWQQRTFPRATAKSVALHLRREAAELVRRPNDPEEMADVFMLLVASAKVSGVDLAEAVRGKFELNKRRVWGAPDADGVVEHVADGAV